MPDAISDGDTDLLRILTARFVPDGFEAGSEEMFRARVVVACSFAISIFGPIYAGLVYVLTGSVAMTVATGVATAGVVATPFLMRRGLPFWMLGNWLTLCGYGLFVYVATSQLGLPVLMWQVVFVILAALVAGQRSALAWLAIMSATTAGFYLQAVQQAPAEGVRVTKTVMIWEMSLIIGMFAAVTVLTLTYEALKDWALDRVRKKEDHTRAILEAAPDGVLTLTGDGRVSQMNPAAESLLGYEESEVDRAPFSTLVPETDEPPPKSVDQELTDGELFDDSISRQIDLQGGLESWAGGNYEARALRRSGERFPAELSVTRIDEDGRFVVMLRDITDRKRAERELRLARDKAVEANEAKSRFLANISHELRTPLNAVIGYSELVHEDLEGTDQAGVLPDIDRITKAGHHLLSLINDILDLSKAEADKMDLYVEEVELDELLEEITDTVRPVVEEKQNTLKIDVDQAPETLRTDRQKLRQMLLNLLSNAAKFTEENLVRLHAFAEEQQGREVCVFEVIDRGIGIPEEKLDELFEAFTQADESTTREYGGTGLGLTITKRFTDMMGGEIDVESQVGEGSTFRITLPVDVEHPDQGRDPTAGEERVEAAERETEAEETRPGEPGATRRGPLVLVIDDDPSVHRLMEQHLGREGFAVETAEGADQGIEKARRLDPDVITLDVLMPDVDGWQTLDRLQSDPELADIPVVMVTIVSDQNMGFSLGASDYLTKPVDREVLAGTLAEHAGKPNGRPIVIAEDDDETRQLLERTVERAGWSTVTAPDGQKALEALDNGIDPSALLLDLMMPNLDGFELLDELRHRPTLQNLPVIVVTAAELSAEERKSLEAKVDQIFRKGDFAHDQLIDELEAALETPKPADRN